MEVETWRDTVQFTAEGTYFDGYSMCELYPECVQQMKEQSRPTDIGNEISMLSSDTQKSPFTIDMCFLNS